MQVLPNTERDPAKWDWVLWTPEGFYDATPGAVIEEINGVESRFGPDVETLLVIGHEPTMSSVALGLATADGSNNTAAERISTKFPTSAIAVLRTGEPWNQLTLSGAALVSFHVAR